MNETNLGKIHVFPSEDSYNSNKESVGSDDLALVPLVLDSTFNNEGHLVFPNGSEFWIE